jgi:hypothetical protein
VSYRTPYAGEGADGARRSAQIDREEADTLAWDNPRRETLLMSAARWEQQAEAIEQQRAWAPPPPRPRPTSGGRIAAYVIVGGLLGMLAGFLAPFLPGFLAQALFAVDIYPPDVGALLGLVMLLTVPSFGVLGALWGMRRANRRSRESPHHR